MSKVILLPYRVIPCDFGHQLDKKIFGKITKYLSNIQKFEIISASEQLSENEAISVRLRIDNPKTYLYLHIYTDGIGIFTLVDNVEEYAQDNFNPAVTLENRRKSHQQILTHSHSCSSLLNEAIFQIKHFFNKNTARLTASENWEKKGFSYVMSFYFIDCDINLITKKEFQEKLIYLLFPFSSDNEFDYCKDFDIKNNIKLQLKEELLNIVRQDSDILPHVHACASWSNFLVIGKISDKVVEGYWKLERDFQRAWFYSYITDKFIENSLRNISTKTTEYKLEAIDDFLTKMVLKISQYEGVISSTLHERDFKLYNTLRTSSRLDILTGNIEKKSGLLKDRLNWLLAEKRFRTDKRIQFILFIIAIISFIASWEKFIKLKTYNFLITVLVLAIASYFFKPFFYKKNRNL